jgi:hypothetical protein
MPTAATSTEMFTSMGDHDDITPRALLEGPAW